MDVEVEDRQQLQLLQEQPQQQQQQMQQQQPKEIELKKLPLPLPPPTTLKIITEKQPLLLSTFDSLCIKIFKKLHSMNKANLFLKLDRNNIGLIHKDNFSALITKVDKTLTTKETLAESWKLATKGDVDKLGLNQKDMEEWIVKCGQR